jgi:spore coat polysaccharide biosynthesis protein SpsF (cytidylyltransferase family)/aryl-alcohol dehydrogenase-like predicted oxidoreductase
MNHSRPSRLIIQSRLPSSRLPAKAMLPVGGIPSVVLCALRAANTGLRLVVATSSELSDDVIATALSTAGIECFRGPHHDVLRRFVQASSDLPDNGILVRLTADNVFPDGSFIEDLLGKFANSGADYLGTHHPQSGLPYGMSAEAFSVAILREADREARSSYDREHVTPWIKRRGRSARYVYPRCQTHWARLRCTLDTFEDYETLLRVFKDRCDPISISWSDLVGRLTDASLGGKEPRCPYRENADGSVHSILTIGAAQIGSQYGIANRSGVPNDDEIRGMLAYAFDAGVTSIDTASVYGRSEERIGALLPRNAADQIRVITKLDALVDVSDDAPRSMIRRAVDASVFKSLHRLRRQRLDTVLIHRWSHHDAWGGEAWARLTELKAEGLIDKLGASVSYPNEANAALADPHVEQLQCPVNIADGRWRQTALLEKLDARPDVVVHARSVLLQGLLTLSASRWLNIPEVNAAEICVILDDLVVSLRRIDRVDLCLAYVASLPWITSLVVGMENIEQLRGNLVRVREPRLSIGEMEVVHERMPLLPSSLLDPALWRVADA